VKSLSLRDRLRTCPHILIANARKPSNLTSYSQRLPSGNLSDAQYEHGLDEPGCLLPVRHNSKNDTTAPNAPEWI
jgi:hypothetical protein